MTNLVPDLTIEEEGVVPAQNVWPPLPGNGSSVSSLVFLSDGIIFRPGVASLGNVFATWAEIKAVIAVTNGALTVFVDDSIAPAVASLGMTDCQGRVTFTSAFQHEKPVTVKLVLPDGAVLKDVKAIGGFLTVEAQGMTIPNFVFTPDRALSLFDGGVLSNVGTQPVIRLAANAFFVVTFTGSSIFSNPTPGAGPFVDLSAAGAQAVIFTVTGSGFTTNNTVTGAAGTSAIFQFDASLGNFPINPGFAGATQKLPIDDSLFISYTPAVLANWSGVAPTSNADALDRIAAKIGPIP
jgi:hypothetical protein